MSRRHVLEREQRLPLPLARVFPFFADARNLDRMFRPVLRFHVVARGPVEMREGAVIHYLMRLYGIPFPWRTRIDVWEPGVRFVDRQEFGPYAYWSHLHAFREEGGATFMRDRVEYELPLGAAGDLVHAVLVREVLERLFARRWRAAELIFAG
jgi:ligand-binding SRPBCC domain-containing protein